MGDATGTVKVDGELARALRHASSQIVDLPAAHRRGHCLEMQMPFIAHLLPDVPIVPMVMGHRTRDTAFALGATIAQAVEAHTRRVARGEQRPLALRGCQHGSVAR